MNWPPLGLGGTFIKMLDKLLMKGGEIGAGK